MSSDNLDVHRAHAWSPAEVSLWLRRAGLSEYVPIFSAEAINGRVLLALSSEELRQELGISQSEARNSILHKITELHRTAGSVVGACVSSGDGVGDSGGRRRSRSRNRSGSKDRLAGDLPDEQPDPIASSSSALLKGRKWYCEACEEINNIARVACNNCGKEKPNRCVVDSSHQETIKRDLIPSCCANDVTAILTKAQDSVLEILHSKELDHKRALERVAELEAKIKDMNTAASASKKRFAELDQRLKCKDVAVNAAQKRIAELEASLCSLTADVQSFSELHSALTGVQRRTIVDVKDYLQLMKDDLQLMYNWNSLLAEDLRITVQNKMQKQLCVSDLTKDLDSVKKELQSTSICFQNELEFWKGGGATFELRHRPHLKSIVQEALRSCVPSDHFDRCSRMRNVIVEDVREVQNIMQWEQYKLKREHIARVVEARRDCPWASQVIPSTEILARLFPYVKLDPKANEVLLFHGTSEEKALTIASQGFDGSSCKRAAYGKGVYFSTDSCKVAEHGSFTTLIVARVCLGHPFVASGLRPNEPLPPEIDGCGCRHDSVIVKPGTPKGKGKGHQVHWEVVIPARGNAQIYPELIVTFTL